MLFAAMAIAATGAAAASSPLNLLDALEIGVFNMGPGEGRITRTFDDTIEQDVLQFDYAVPRSSIIGVWTKS